MVKEQSYIERTSGITFKEKIGYAAGDVASLMLFGLETSILQKYFTDVLGINLWWALGLFIVARIWDAVNDPIWGRIVDSMRAGRRGRYRPWLLYLCVPVAISAVLMFIKIPGLNAEGYFIYASVTYILFGTLYTGTNIPYGSLASVITTSEKERSQLSVYRSAGSMLGNVPVLLLIALIKIVPENSAKITLFVGITALLSVGVHLLCYYWTKERVPMPPVTKRKKGELSKIISTLINSRPFISLCVAALLLLATQMFCQSYYLYLFNSYFNAQWLGTLNQVATYLPVLLIMPFVAKLNNRFGKKEVSAAGMFIASFAYILLYLLNSDTPVVFLIFGFISGIGNAFFFLQVWALVTDAIDATQAKTGIREEATSYSFFTFTRKFGQTLASILSLMALISLGYGEEWIVNPASVPFEATSKMYTMAVVIPAVMYLIIGLILWLWYPLGKKEVDKLQMIKEEKLRELFENSQ